MKTKQERVRTIGYSLVSKLNIQLWVRLLGIFLSLNILFLLGSGISLLILGEQLVLEIIPQLEKENVNGNLVLGEVEIQLGLVEGFSVPEVFKHVFPVETRKAQRRIDLPNLQKEDISLYQLFDNLQYKVSLIEQGQPYTITIYYKSAIWLLKHLFLVLLMGQLLIALRTILSRAELIRRVLKPISDLAEQAHILSQDKGPLSIGEMEALAGTLDEINAARLDTRIDLDSTQDELKNLAQAINNLLNRINESYRLQARFVSDASHELRTPIAAIQGYANLLDRWGKNDPEALQESIAAIKEETANMKDLVEQLLFLARGDNHTMPLQLEKFDLRNLAKIIYNETGMINGGHVFRFQGEEGFVLADYGLIKQAGRILVDNAIKYTPLGGEIVISVSRMDNQVFFTVQDSGIGIGAQDLPHIFERFYRADESRARATGGTGLGLSIAQWIVQRHGGYLEVLSREDFGSRISIVLPENRSN